ncbi:MAG: LuxR C-terminal-related transcriptional regulator [Synergistaceae bacterium]|nr:LuxR C-terminal-related transcriptional regulator [Synergistaceae bacterium]
MHSKSTISPENRTYLERPRINKLFRDAVESPLVTVSAGAGYGKTQAVYSFLRQYEAVTTWIQLSERDNLGTRFWENFVCTVALRDRRFAERLREAGFPEADDQFTEYLSFLENVIVPSEKNVIVFDDFHLIEDRSVLQFIRRSVQLPFHNITTILISRMEPDISTISLLSKGLVFSVSENDLRFTEEETARYFQLLGVPLSSQDLSNIYDDTAGWAFSLHLIGLSLKKAPSHSREASIAMKLNIFRMIENEIFLVNSERLQRFLLRLSLIDRLSTALVSILAEDETLVDEMKKISSFIRYDSYLDAYLIHHLFLDYLRQRQKTLTEEEKCDTYLKAARWCNKNDYKMDAISYYDKAGKYKPIMKILYHFPLQIPMNQAKFVLDIYDNGPTEQLEQFAFYPLQRSRLLVSLGRYEEAVAENNDRIRKYSTLPNSDFNNRVLCSAYQALGFINYFTLPWTDRCNFDVLLEKADYYYQLSPYNEFGPVTNISLDAWASKVGTARSGAMEEYVETLTRAIPHMVNILNGCMYGLDDLARGEMQFYKGDLKIAERLIKQALSKAEARSQYEVRNRALFYLLRIGVAQGDFERIQGLVKDLEAQLKISEYSTRFITYDIVSSWLYSTFGQPQLVANWLKGNFEQGSLAIFKANFGNCIKARYYYANKRYDELLSFLESGQAPNEVLFGKLEMKVLEAICKYQIKKRDASLLALREAYDLALSNDLTMPFIELGKDMRTLTATAMRDRNCAIPRQWLEVINRKATTYAKRLALVVSEYKRANNLEGAYDTTLSPRETDVLNDLYHGLSRSEIAASHDLSINTVKMTLSSLYTKLDADNVADVIRIALDRKLINYTSRP